MLAAAFRIGIAAHHAIHSLRDFDLQPFAAAALFVTTAAPFGDDPFQAFLLRHIEKSFAIVKMVGEANEFSWFKNAGENFFALLERNTAQVIAIHIEHIEKVIDDGNLRFSRHLPSMLADSGTLLHQAE